MPTEPWHPPGMEAKAVTREALYELVWSKPMSRLAEEFGISDVALAKTCRKHEIPIPGRGYWAQLTAGQNPKRPKLLRHPASAKNRILFRSPAVDTSAPRPPPPTIEVRDRMSDPHPAVR
jgi:hypothetical protein